MPFFAFNFETSSAALLVVTVLLVGVLHTLVPDHWVPITLIARQRGWTRGETARAAFKAGTGHVVTTLILAAIVWLAGVAVAAKFGHWVDIVSSVALIAFGLWIAISSWRQISSETGHGHGPHGHSHDFSHFAESGTLDLPGIHGPELQTAANSNGAVSLSIFESGQPPRFRFSQDDLNNVQAVDVETLREDGGKQNFALVTRKGYWESKDAIPEPHGFKVRLAVTELNQRRTYEMEFAEHEHGHDHAHSAHDEQSGTQAGKPKVSSRTALLLILGSSPMVEGIPAFFAAGKYGAGLVSIMAVVFAASTILTYVLLCVYSTVGLQRVKFGALERYGEVLSGAFIALVGLAFWVFPLV